jgi:hypothetical protein
VVGVTQRRIIKWEDPPESSSLCSKPGPGRPAGSQWDPIAEALREEPGRWALIFEGEKGAASSLRARIVTASVLCFCPRGAFQAKERVWAGVYSVYARYVGEGR